jgi:hypothetical protein
MHAPLARLDSIQLGNLSKHDFPVAVADMNLSGQKQFDGILGMDFLQSYSLHINNREGTILLRPETEAGFDER